MENNLEKEASSDYENPLTLVDFKLKLEKERHKLERMMNGFVGICAGGIVLCAAAAYYGASHPEAMESIKNYISSWFR